MSRLEFPSNNPRATVVTPTKDYGTNYGMVKILKCSLSGAWYSSMVGHTVTLRRPPDYSSDMYWAYEPHEHLHFVNIISKNDAVIVSLPQQAA